MKTGERIDGRYKIIRLIGSGGMANVYLARDLILDRDVAVKVMRYDFREDKDSIRRFKREALATTELVHPNIVNIFDVGEEDTTPYIVMEYVKGTDLKQYIQNQYPIPYKKAVDIMEQILSGVEYAHQHGVIHRDLKPQNILIDEEEHIKISDFGIAVAVSQNSITQTNSLLGSVHYLSPEQARGSMASRQSDIYSLGIILYELLTGTVPFDGESAVSVALKHFQNPLPSLKNFDSRIPQPLENIVLKATAKQALDRYRSVQEMAEDLATVLEPSRRGEPPFEVREEDTEKTITLTPILDEPVGPEEDQTQAATAPTQGNAEKPNVPNKKQGKKRWRILIGVLVIVIAALLYFLISAPKAVEVPEIAGMTEAAARQALEEKKLTVGEVLTESNEEIEEDLIIRTSPAAGTAVREEQKVDLFISSGRATVEFKNYERKKYEEVRAQLTEMGFTVNKEEENNKEIPAGSIISQDIPEGSEVVPSDTTVTFVVSLGEAGVELQDLSGYSLRGVEDYVREHDLNLITKEENSEDVLEGLVISQSPAAGKTVYSNDSITVVISTGPKDNPIAVFTRKITIQYKAVESEEETEESTTEKAPNHIEIYLEDSQHDFSNVYRQLDITEDTSVDLPFILEEGKKGRFKILRDGEVIQEEKDITE